MIVLSKGFRLLGVKMNKIDPALIKMIRLALIKSIKKNATVADVLIQIDKDYCEYRRKKRCLCILSR